MCPDPDMAAGYSHLLHFICGNTSYGNYRNITGLRVCVCACVCVYMRVCSYVWNSFGHAEFICSGPLPNKTTTIMSPCHISPRVCVCVCVVVCALPRVCVCLCVCLTTWVWWGVLGGVCGWCAASSVWCWW